MNILSQREETLLLSAFKADKPIAKMSVGQFAHPIIIVGDYVSSETPETMPDDCQALDTLLQRGFVSQQQKKGLYYLTPAGSSRAEEIKSKAR